EGNLTLVWSAFDPAYVRLVGHINPCGLDPKGRARVEEAILPAPAGGRWRFENPARCAQCAAWISGPMADWSISYLVFPGSGILDEGPGRHHFERVLRSHRQAV